MLERLGRLMHRGRWAVIAVWLAIFLGAAVFAPRVSGVLQGGGYTIGNSQSVAAYSRLNQAYGYRALMFTVVFAGSPAESRRMLADAKRFRRLGAARFPGQLTISAPVFTPDRAVVFERISSQPQQDLGAHFAGPLQALLPSGAVQGYLTGPSAIYHDMEVVSNEDLRQIELITLPIAALVLLFIFGSLVAAGVPVLMAPVTVTFALAIIYFLGHRIAMSIFVLNTASMLGLAVAIDYSLFMVNRFREELRLGRDLETAVGRTVATSGRAILVSAIVVTLGFFALTLSGVQMLSSLGYGGSIVTFLSLLVALTLLPAMLGVLGPRINLLPVVPERFATGHVWHRVARAVMRRPVMVIGFVSVVIAVLAIPAFHLRVGVPGPDILPASAGARAGNDILSRHLGYANQDPVLVVVTRQPHTPVATAQSTAFVVFDRICSSPQVVGVATVPITNSPRQIQSCQQALTSLQNAEPGTAARLRRLAAQQRVALISVFLRADPSSAAAERYVTSLRHQPSIPDYQVLIGGQTAGQMDFDSYLYAHFPWVVLFVVITIYVVLLLAFRSVLLPLKAVLMNGFSVLAAYGAVVFAFQDAHLANVLGFTPVGNIDSIVPVFLFCVLFGVSTDYEVFLLTRVQEEYRQTGDNEESVAVGLESTGRIITSAALVMIVVFGAFSFARLVIIKEVGLGLAAGVLVDATLIRALLVPATMRLLGRWNWWLPGRGFLPAARPEPVRSGKSPAAQ